MAKRANEDSNISSKDGKSKKKCTDSNILQMESKSFAINTFFSSLSFYFLPAGFQKARLTLFKTQIKRWGGNVQETFNVTDSISHIIVDDSMDITRLKRLLKVEDGLKLPIVKSSWLSRCLRNKQLENIEEFRLYEETSTCSTVSPLSVSSITKSNKASNGRDNGGFSGYESSDEEKLADNLLNPATGIPSTSYVRIPETSKWICSQSSKNPRPNSNKFITDKLEEMVKAYESTNDKWRAFGYQKAIQSLRKYPKEISSWEEAKSLPGIGGRLADKIWEIAQSGELRKLKEFQSDEKVQVLDLFTNVWGAGPHTAQLWYQQGFRTIADLQEKASLNHQQKIGVRLYEDILDRMPREEAAEIEQVVRATAESIQPGIIAQICGSYRRGKATCGDVDVLVTHPDGRSHKNVFPILLAKLKETNFLTDDLVSAEDTGNQKKYMGVCKLPGENRKHRRIDVIAVPYNEYGCALVYFTGSAHFNRSLRHLCKVQNMSLNEHALKEGVVRKCGEKLHEGTIIPTPTEESVFRALKVPYRPPEERDH